MFLPRLFEDISPECRQLLDPSAPWLALSGLAGHIAALLEGRGKALICSPVPKGAIIGEQVYIGPDCIIESGVYIKGPAWIGRGCILRYGCYCRENVFAESGVLLGHASEIKNSWLMSGAEVPHFNYVGDSILGRKAHLGAGVILSNVRLDKKTILLKDGMEHIDTGLEKFGAIIGDRCEIGCNSVINPGSIIGTGSVLYPLSRWKGIMTEHTVYRD
jgi:NDP-sugar pyrophosphorylase family protein